MRNIILLLILLFVNELNAANARSSKYTLPIQYCTNKTIPIFMVEVDENTTTVLDIKKKFSEQYPSIHNLEFANYGIVQEDKTTLALIGSGKKTAIVLIQKLFNFCEAPLSNKNIYTLISEDNPYYDAIKKLEQDYRTINSQETYDEVAAEWLIIQDMLVDTDISKEIISNIQKIFDSSTYAALKFEELDLRSHLNSLKYDQNKFSVAEVKLLEMIESSNLSKISDEKELYLLQKLYYRFLIEIYTSNKLNLGDFKREPGTYKVILEVNNYLQRYSDQKKNIPLEFFFEEESFNYFKANISKDDWKDLSLVLSFLKQTDDSIKQLIPNVNRLFRKYKTSPLPQELGEKICEMQKQLTNYRIGSLFSIKDLPNFREVDGFLKEYENKIYIKNDFKTAVINFTVAHIGLTNNDMTTKVESLLIKYNDQRTVSYFINQLCHFIRQRAMGGVSFVKRAR